MSSYETIDFKVEDNVAVITLNRPDAANALNWRMTQDLFEVSIACSTDDSIRAVVLTAAGRLFCGGGDLKEFSENEGSLDPYLKRMTAVLHAGISRLTRMPKPLIGAINGTAGGAGFSLACACDIAFIAETAKMTLAYTAAGLTPDGSSTYFLPRIVGTRRALELAYTNRRLTAQEALEWGLVNYVVPTDEVLSEAMKLATKLANGPTKAFAGAKKLIAFSFNESLETQMELEAEMIAAMSHTEDVRNGITAFISKQKPVFKGK